MQNLCFIVFLFFSIRSRILSGDEPSSKFRRGSRLSQQCPVELLENHTGHPIQDRHPFLSTAYQNKLCNNQFTTTCCTDKEFVKLGLKMKLKVEKLEYFGKTFQIIVQYLWAITEEDFEQVIDALPSEFYEDNGFTREELLDTRVLMMMNLNFLNFVLDKIISYVKEFQRAHICSFCDSQNSAFYSILMDHETGEFQTQIDVESRQCPFVLKSSQSTQFDFFLSALESLYQMFIVFGEYMNRPYRQDSIQRNKDLSAEKERLTLQCEHFIKGEPTSDPECLDWCSDNILSNGQFFFDNSYDIEFAQRVLHDYFHKYKSHEDRKKAHKLERERHAMPFVQNQERMPRFKCYLKGLDEEAPDLCQIRNVYSNSAGINFKKYLKYSETSYNIVFSTISTDEDDMVLIAKSLISSVGALIAFATVLLF